jgi:4-amino-4-deoxy-L-arabinose transferase-like glycosyltransferase
VNPGRVAWWPAFAIAGLTAALYFPFLGETPAALGGDEARFGAAAHAVATSGRDTNGIRLPLFFHMSDAADGGGTRWYQPLLFYLIALVLQVGRLSETAIRVPTAMIAVADVFLVYVVARRLFRGAMLPAAAALMLTLTPAHLIFARQALDYICPLPFVLIWLACLFVHLQTGNVWWSACGGAILGLGFYSYIAAWILTPACLALTLLAQRADARLSRESAAAAVVAFAIPLLVVVPWLWSHPEMLRDTIGRYKVYDTRLLSPLQGVKDFLNYNNVQERISVYWDYFNPAYLFFAGGSNLTHSTRKVGVFLLPVAVFLVCGIGDLWQRRRSAASIVLLAGLALSPVPATLVDERYAVQRELVLLPFVVLISTYGLAWLVRHERRLVRLTAALLVAAMPFQFTYFYRDYIGEYRVRSAHWFDPPNFQGVAAYLLKDAGPVPPAVYFSADLDDVGPRWRFYLAKVGREDLLQRTRYFGEGAVDVNGIPAGALLVLYSNDARAAALVQSNSCAVAKVIVDLTGANSAIILRKTA